MSADIASPLFGAIMALLGAVMAIYRTVSRAEARQWIIYAIGMVILTAIIYLNPAQIFRSDEEGLKVFIAIGLIFVFIAFVVDNRNRRRSR